MGRKKNPGFYIYPDDITSSERCNALSREAYGVYFALLLRLSKPPMPGCYRLQDWVPRPNWSRSDVQKCLRTADKRERLAYFAKWLAKNDLPWEKTEVLPCFQELYDRGIIIVEGDMLIQPRMFRDNGFEIPDIDNDGNPEGTILDDPVSGAMIVTDDVPTLRRRQKNNVQINGTINGTEKGTINSTKKGTINPRVRSGDAPAQSKRVGVGDNNMDSIGNIGGAGGMMTDNGKTPGKSPNGKNGASEGVTDSGVYNLPSDGQKRATKPANGKNGHGTGTPASAPIYKKEDRRIPVAIQPPTLMEIQDYMQSRGEQGDPFRHITAEQFYDEGCMSGWTIRGGQPLYDWRARLRSLEGYRRKNGEEPVTQEGYVAYHDGKLVGTLSVKNNSNQRYEGSSTHQRVAARSQGGHTDGDDGMLQQSVRIIERIRASRQADAAEGADTDGDTR